LKSANQRLEHWVHELERRMRELLRALDQVWTWDITKLLGPGKWTYFHLYVILHIFSRYVVGWMVAPRETAELAKRLIADTCQKQGIVAGTLTVHADSGESVSGRSSAPLQTPSGNAGLRVRQKHLVVLWRTEYVDAPSLPNGCGKRSREFFCFCCHAFERVPKQTYGMGSFVQMLFPSAAKQADVVSKIEAAKRVDA